MADDRCVTLWRLKEASWNLICRSMTLQIGCLSCPKTNSIKGRKELKKILWKECVH